MPGKELTYAQLPSAGAVGFRYETKIITFSALKLYYQYGCESFVLGTNLINAGKFDDVVIKFKTHDKVESWFIQLKHSLNPKDKKISLSKLRSDKKNKDFYLKKYYESFETVKKRYVKDKKTSEESVIFSGDFDNAKFIIFTNSELDDALQSYGLVGETDMLLSTNTKQELNVKLTSQLLNAANENISLGKHDEEFLDHFMLCTGQAGEKEIDQLIESVLQEEGHLPHDEANMITSKLLQFIDKWCGTKSFLTKEKVHKELEKLKLQIKGLKPDDISVKFREEFLSAFRVSCAGSKIVAVISELDNALLSMAAVQQSISGSAYKTLSLHQVADMREALLAERNTLLIVDCEKQASDVDLGSLSESIVDFTRNPGNRVILVMSSRFKKMAAFMIQCRAKQIVFHCSLQDLTDECKELVLEGCVDFQGYSVRLSSLIPDSEPLADLGVLTRLLTSQDVRVGIPPAKSIPYYVTRVLLRYPFLNPNFFVTKKKLGTYALSGTTIDEVKAKVAASDKVYTVDELLPGEKDVKFVLLNNDRDLDKVRKTQTNVHWISKEGKFWKWRGSSGGNVQGISTQTSNKSEYTLTSEFLNLERTTVLTAEPGMGKTTLTDHMAAEMKQINPLLWVITVPLNDFTHMFQHPEWFTASERCVKTLLRTAAGVDHATDNALNAILFEQCYSSPSRDKMVVLLDGFDEVYLDYKHAVWRMLQVLQNSNVLKIWVSARPTLKDVLQSKLGTLSYSLKPFDCKDQKKFFAKFWMAKHPKIAPLDIERFIEKLLEVLSKSVADAEQFTGIPLQTRMVSEAFDDKMTEFVTTGVLSLPQKINILELFNRFVETKFKIVRDEKAKIDATNSRARRAQEQLAQLSQNDLMTMALIVVLPHSEWCSVNPPINESVVDKMKQKVYNCEEESGIVDYFDTSPHFLHRTFAEYFAAKFFASNFELNRAFLKSEVFLSDSFGFIRHLFDRMLADGFALQNAVLDADVESFARLLKQCNSVTLEVDKGGRSALHLAAASDKQNKNFVKELLKAGLGTTETDKVLLWSPLEYALSVSQSLHSIGAIMEHGAERESAIVLSKLKVNDPLLAVKTAVQNDYLELYRCLEKMEVVKSAGDFVLRNWTWLESDIQEYSNLTLLHLAAHYGAVKVLRHVLSKQPELLQSRDLNRKTCLHHAVESQNSDVVSFLLAHKVDLTAEDSEGRTCLQYAITLKNYELLEVMLSALQEVGIESHDKVVRAIVVTLSASSEPSCLRALSLALLLFPGSKDLLGPKDISPLATAAQKGLTEPMRMLLNAGANVNLVMKHNFTALHLAVAQGEADAVRLLTDNVATNIEARAFEGETPLYMSASRGHSDVFQLLVDRGADLRTRTDHGNTLLHALAVPGSDPTIFGLLVERGVDIAARNKEGRTALDLMRLHHADVGIKNMINVLEALEPSVLKVHNTVHDDASSGKTLKNKAEVSTMSAELSTGDLLVNLVNQMSDENKLALRSLLMQHVPSALETPKSKNEKKKERKKKMLDKLAEEKLTKRAKNKNKIKNKTATEEIKLTKLNSLQTTPVSDNKHLIKKKILIKTEKPFDIGTKISQQPLTGAKSELQRSQVSVKSGEKMPKMAKGTEVKDKDLISADAIKKAKKNKACTKNDGAIKVPEKFKGQEKSKKKSTAENISVKIEASRKDDVVTRKVVETNEWKGQETPLADNKPSISKKKATAEKNPPNIKQTEAKSQETSNASNKPKRKRSKAGGNETPAVDNIPKV